MQLYCQLITLDRQVAASCWQSHNWPSLGPSLYRWMSQVAYVTQCRTGMLVNSQLNQPWHTHRLDTHTTLLSTAFACMYIYVPVTQSLHSSLLKKLRSRFGGRRQATKLQIPHTHRSPPTEASAHHHHQYTSFRAISQLTVDESPSSFDPCRPRNSQTAFHRHGET